MVHPRLVPNIDYLCGGQVYAGVWKRAAQAVREADLVVIFGTDHHGSDPFTLTRQQYATPYGVLPTAHALINDLAGIIGEKAAFAGELRHRNEHSLELMAVWLHHLQGGQSVELAPILVGGLHHYIYNGASPANHPLLAQVVATIRKASERRRMLVVASGDLAHVGPAFGGAPLNAHEIDRVTAADRTLLAHLCTSDANGFFAAIQQARDANNVCGVTPLYMTMRTVDQVRGEQVGYAVCPADKQETSIVTIGGVFFH
jgi:AmmeMemoRadiSam system protein B